MKIFFKFSFTAILIPILIFSNAVYPENFNYKQNLKNKIMIQNGEKLFSTNCTVCHGKEGMGGGIGPKLNSFWDVDDTYLSVEQTILKGRANTAMVGWKGRLTDNEVNQIIIYLANLNIQHGKKVH